MMCNLLKYNIPYLVMLPFSSSLCYRCITAIINLENLIFHLYISSVSFLFVSQPCTHMHRLTWVVSVSICMLALYILNEQCNPRFQCAGHMLLNRSTASLELSHTEWQLIKLGIRGMPCVLYVKKVLYILAMKWTKGKLGSLLVNHIFLWMHVPCSPETLQGEQGTLHTFFSLSILKGKLIFFTQESLFTVLGEHDWMCARKSCFVVFCGLR